MTSRKKILKVFIIIILAVFLLSTGLMSLLYLGGAATQNSESGTGENLEMTWTTTNLSTGDVGTWN